MVIRLLPPTPTCGVYLLHGPGSLYGFPPALKRKLVYYIGESADVFRRLRDHATNRRICPVGAFLLHQWLDGADKLTRVRKEELFIAAGHKLKLPMVNSPVVPRKHDLAEEITILNEAIQLLKGNGQ